MHFHVKYFDTLLQSLQQAGGPKVWGDSTVTVLRSGEDGKQKRITVSLQALLSGETAENVILQNGDIVTVSSTDSQAIPSGQDRIYMVGAVNKPGAVAWRENLTALDALMSAGGLAEYAAGNRARLVRGSGGDQQEIPIKFEDILEGEKEKNILLSPGDMIIVPEGIGFF